MICKICNQEIGSNGFGRHIKIKHNIESKDYYDLYLKSDLDGYCLVCNKPTNFMNNI